MNTSEMTITDWLLDQLECEAPRTRRVLEHFPEGRDDWKPHPRSMPLARLATLVATMPTWVPLIIEREELDVAPKNGGEPSQKPLSTRAALLRAHDRAVEQAGKSLLEVSDGHMLHPWRLLSSGIVVAEDPRYVVVRDTLMHQSHHRGQLTVYLRLNDLPVPSVYGPTADDPRFA